MFKFIHWGKCYCGRGGLLEVKPEINAAAREKMTEWLYIRPARPWPIAR